MYIEQGPIRPPSEAASLLIRLTRNCPWNRCEFCDTFMGRQFSRRTVEEIKKDIDTLVEVADKVRERSVRMGYGGTVNHYVLADIYKTDDYLFAHVGTWLGRGGRTVFLQDANSLVMKSSDLVEVLSYLKEKFPSIERVTSYARSKTLAGKTLQELRDIRAAGLTRIHVGLESGSDAVLKFMNKGVTAREHVKAGQLVVAAGISLSEYVILGLGGRLWPEEHPIETAKVLNEINPDFIRLRTLTVPEASRLKGKVDRGEFVEQTEEEIVAGERLFINGLEGINSRVVSDHAMNLLEEVYGKLPGEKDQMLAVIDRFLSMPLGERTNFRLGKRWGIYRRLDDMADPGRHGRVDEILRQLETEGTLESTLYSIRLMVV